MKKLNLILTTFIAAALIFSFSGCGDDGEDSTGPVGGTLTSEETNARIQASLEQVGFASVCAAMGEATAKWDGWEKPDIGGYGKITSEWYRYENGWHMYHLDTTMTETSGGSTTTMGISLDEQLRFTKDGAYVEEAPDDLDKLEEKTDLSLTATLIDSNSGTTEISLDADVDAVLERMANDDLKLNLDETFGMQISGTSDEFGTGTFSYDYTVNVTDLVVSPDDNYAYPKSGTLTMTITVTVTDQSGTASGTGTAAFTFDDGDVDGSINVGNDTFDANYVDVCGSGGSFIGTYADIVRSFTK